MENDTKINLLINILLDANASLAERDDAAMDLGLYANEEALKALILIASDPKKNLLQMLQESP